MYFFFNVSMKEVNDGDGESRAKSSPLDGGSLDQGT